MERLIARIHGGVTVDGFDDLLNPGGSTPPVPEGQDVRALAGPATRETADQVKESLGIGVRRVRYRPPEGPDVSGLAEGLGLK